MLGRLNLDSPHPREATIVGAGISGLLAAYALDRAGYTVHLFESGERSGGMIATRQSPHGLVERAAHSIPATPAVRALCADLGVELLPLDRAAGARWIWRSGKPRRFPLGFFEMLGTLFRAYFALAPAADPESLTLAEWTRRFLGEKALRYLITPFTRGIYGADPSELSVSAAFPSLCVPRGHSLLSYLLARKWRKPPPQAVKRAIRKLPRGVMSAPLHGMQALTDALEKRLVERLGSRFVRGRAIGSLDELGDEPGKDPGQAANLLLCVPAHEAARLLAEDSPELSDSLARVRYSPLLTATVFVPARALPRVPRGVGILMPPGEGRNCLGILYDSAAFPGRVPGIAPGNAPGSADEVSLTLMFGASPALPDSAHLPALIRDELRDVFGFQGQVSAIYPHSWERAIPRYDAHLLHTWELAERSWCAVPGQILMGNYTGQVSLRGMVEEASLLTLRALS